MSRLLFIQPILTSYRRGLLVEFMRQYELKVAAGVQGYATQGFCMPDVGEIDLVRTHITKIFGGRFFYQHGLLRQIWEFRPSKVVMFGNPRYFSCWLVLLLCRALGIDCYLHGQGLYGYEKPSIVQRILYCGLVAMSSRYLCYAEISRKSLEKIGANHNKLAVVDNSMDIASVVRPDEKRGLESGIMFVGRLRVGCELDRLIAAVHQLREGGDKVFLHVVGAGELENYYLGAYSDRTWIKWYGAVYDEEQVASISRGCRVGCYPGDAGLSIVHFFALSLPPVVHSTITSHMGPEPSYVVDKENGFHFPKDQANGLFVVLSEIWRMPRSEIARVSEGSYAKYASLSVPSFGARFIDAIS